MKTLRLVPSYVFTVVMLVACGEGPEKVTVDPLTHDSLAVLQSQLSEQALQASLFVNEVNKELARSKSLKVPAQLQTPSDLAELNAERNDALKRIAQLVDQMEGARGRLVGLRRQVAQQDSTMTARVGELQVMLADATAAAEKQRAELQGTIDEQSARIASLTSTVDTLKGKVGALTAEKYTVYVVAGTRDELIKKGVLVPEGRRKFLVAGKRPVVPARDLDPSVFTKIDRRVDSTIFLPDGVYKIVSRQNGSLATPIDWKDGIVGGLKIEDPERFWNTSRYLILVKT